VEAAIVLGAVLGPTDPVAATAIAGRVGAPRRIVTILEGESLVNDSTALIAFKFAVARPRWARSHSGRPPWSSC
jgi:CPA1 family monovalent cation:H+ antiporter